MKVNRHVSVDGDVTFTITNWSEDGYVGWLTDTVYENGSDSTYWCEFVGTQEECEEYIRTHE